MFFFTLRLSFFEVACDAGPANALYEGKNGGKCNYQEYQDISVARRSE